MLSALRSAADGSSAFFSALLTMVVASTAAMPAGAADIAILANRAFVGSEASGNCAWEPEQVQAALNSMGSTELFEVADAASIAGRLNSGQLVVIPDQESGDLVASWGASASLVRIALQGGGRMLVFGTASTDGDITLINSMLTGSTATPLTNGSVSSGSVNREPTYPAEFALAPASLNWVNGTYYVTGWNVGTVVYRNGADVGVAVAPVGQGQIGFIAYDFYCPQASAAAWTSVTQAMVQHMRTPLPGASTEVIGFDDLAANSPATVLYYGDVPAGYRGFEWSDSAYAYRPFPGVNSGYANGVVSGSQGGFTAYSEPVTISRPTRWTFRGAYFTAAWNTGLNVRITATRGGRVVYDQTRVLGAPTAAQYLSFDYFNIDSITITPSGGTNYGFGYSGTHLAIDNFTFSPISTEVIEFEDVETPNLEAPLFYYGQLPPGYRGFEWSTSGYAYRVYAGSTPSGYVNGVVSGSQGGFTAYANTITVSRGDRWNFHGAYFTAAWNTGLNVRVRGFRGGAVVYDQTRVLGAPTAATYLAFDYLDIDSIDINPSGGSNYGFGYYGEHLALDDFTYSIGTAAPTVSLVSATATTCSLNNGAIDISVANASSIAWSGPGGFSSTNEDISGLAPGSYSVTVTGAGGTASLTAIVESTADTTDPVISGYTAFATASAGEGCTAAVPDFRPSVVASDNCTGSGLLSVSQIPAPGTAVGLGATAVTISVTDASGNVASAGAVLSVTGNPQQYYADEDGDGVGAGSPVTACTQPAGYVLTAGDGCPTDPAKLEPGFCGCGVADVDLNGNGILDCADVYVTMSVDPAPLAAGETFSVRVSSTASFYALTGVQLAVLFDAAHVQLVSVVPVAGTPFTLDIANQVNNSDGTLRYAAGIAPGTVGTNDALELVDLVFVVRSDTTLCGESVLARFGTISGFTSRFSRQGGSFLPIVTGLAPRELDALAPVLAGVPTPVSLPADAGSAYGAFVENPLVMSDDACDGAIVPSISIVFPGGGTASTWPSDGMFPIGVSSVTWSTVDSKGNASEASTSVTVLDHQLLDASVCFTGSLGGTSSREVRFSIGGQTTVRQVAMTGSCGTTAGMQVPVSAGYSCMIAKDPVHSLTAPASVSVAGTRYSAAFELKQGDSNDDDMIDIVDFGLFIDDFGAERGRDARSNFNADTYVNNADFSFIAINFFTVGEDCTGGLTGRTPRGAVRVKDLRREGLGHLAVADLNADGWVDQHDVQAYVQGGIRVPATTATSEAPASGGTDW